MSAADARSGSSTVPVEQLTLDPGFARRLVAAAAASPDGGTVTTITPMTGGPLARIPQSTEADVVAAYQVARAAQRSWALRPMAERSAIMLRFHDLVLRRQGPLLDLIQLESGKARLHAFEEIVDTCQVARHYARTARRLLRTRRRPGLVPGLTEVVEMRHPKGVVGVVAPWNYPLSMGITDALPALLAGNAVVLRPDSQTPLTSLCCLDLLRRAGLPPDVLQIVLGPGATIGAAVLAQADAVCFTGSTATGRIVAEGAGRRLQATSLELGGKNALYVRADADLRRAVDGAVRAAFSSAGQLCVSVERIILDETIADAFLARFIATVRSIRVSTRLTYGADMGSLVSADQLAKVTAHVEDARAKGATVLTGGRPLPHVGPFCYAPTVLTRVDPSMTVYAEETFGPVVSIYRVPGDAAAVALANDTPYGLNASVWTRDLERGRAVAAAIRAGSVNINEGYAASYASPAAPMGGMKDSGIGRRHGVEGITKYTDVQTIATQRGVGLGIPHRVDQSTGARVISRGLSVLKVLGRR